MTLVAVLGATGAQGGSVANRLLASPDTYKGAEVVFADVNDAATLAPALEGVEALFVVTAYWPSIPKLGRDGAGDEEVAQFQAIADAAAKTPTIKHVVLSTLPRCAKMSGGKFPVPHYDYKQIAVDWIRATHPALWAKTTEFWPGWYTSNLATLMRPVPLPGTEGGYLLPLPSKPDAMLPMAGNLQLNAGLLVEAVPARARQDGRQDRHLHHRLPAHQLGRRQPHQTDGRRQTGGLRRGVGRARGEAVRRLRDRDGGAAPVERGVPGLAPVRAREDPGLGGGPRAREGGEEEASQFREVARGDQRSDVLESIEKEKEKGLQPVKV
ncbi:hypothetical protein PG997_007045 [Apiospora hydei]|uniref:NmrA-like domain-containing protein n=1 Tax=Apiospora hydei TaxID=1337664 RepID=A0ABR1WSA1_9PEZI